MKGPLAGRICSDINCHFLAGFNDDGVLARLMLMLSSYDIKIHPVQMYGVGHHGCQDWGQAPR